MKKLIGFLGLVGMVFVIVGCASKSGISIGQANAGSYANAHEWKMPAFTADLKSNPVKSELVLGFVTVGSHAGYTPHPEDKWVSFDCSVGPLVAEE